MPAARTTGVTGPAPTPEGIVNLRVGAERRLRHELEQNGMQAADAIRVARELVNAGLVKVGRESGDQPGFLANIVEAGIGGLEAVGFGAAAHVGTQAAGGKSAASQAGKIVTKAEQPGVEGAEKLPGLVGNPIWDAIKELVGTYGLRLGELLAGAALILFGLATLAKGAGAKTPSLPVVG